LRQYVDGLLSDSGRTSMQAMLVQVPEPTSYETFRHVITDAPWGADAVWRRPRAAGLTPIAAVVDACRIRR
jgi:hypothetical protein